MLKITRNLLRKTWLQGWTKREVRYCTGASFLKAVVPSYKSMDCSLPGSSVLGILQARILEWVVIPFSRAPDAKN